MGKCIELAFAKTCGVAPSNKKQFNSIIGRGKAKVRPTTLADFMLKEPPSGPAQAKLEEAHVADRQAKRLTHLAGRLQLLAGLRGQTEHDQAKRHSYQSHNRDTARAIRQRLGTPDFERAAAAHLRRCRGPLSPQPSAAS